MPRPILKELPKGSPAEDYLADLTKDIPPDGVLCDDTGESLWRSDDPVLRYIGERGIRDVEHRAWKMPQDFVRDRRVLSDIASTYGPEVAHAMKTFAPQVLDDYTNLVCDRAYRVATARERRPAQVDNSGLIAAMIVAAVVDELKDSRSLNDAMQRAGDRLGVNRHAIRRCFDKERRRISRLEPAVRDAVFAAIAYVRARMAQRDRATGSRPVQR